MNQAVLFGKFCRVQIVVKLHDKLSRNVALGICQGRQECRSKRDRKRLEIHCQRLNMRAKLAHTR